MHSRRRRGYRSLPRQFRLAAFAAALCLVALACVLMVRCSRGDAGLPASAGPGVTAAAPATTAPEAQPTAAPAVQPSASADVPGSTGPGAGLNTPAARPSGQKRKAVIRSFGDIIAHKPIYTTAYDSEAKTYDFSPYFQLIGDSLLKADYTVGNVDGPMGGKGSRGYREYPQFNTPPHLLYALKEYGVDMLTLANNHALDTYVDGLKRQIDNVDKVGIDHIGAYRTQEEYDAPKVVEIGGIKVGFTNYTVSTNNFENRVDPDAMKYVLRTTRNSSPTRDIASLRQAGAEVVVAYMHWGDEYVREVNDGQVNLARKLVAAGADIIVGGHPHVVQAIQYVSAKDADGNDRRALVVYSMGNFLSDQRTRYRDSGIIFEFTLSDDGSGRVTVEDPRYIPTYVWRTKIGGGYDYRIVACGDILENRPGNMDDETFSRVGQVWNELQALIGDGASIARN